MARTKPDKVRAATARVARLAQAAKAAWTGPRLPGRPRKDGLPPIQRKKIAAEELPQIEINHELVSRVRFLAGRGMPPKYISAMTRIPIEELEPGGRFAEEITIGKAEAALVVMEATYTRAVEGKTIETLFWLKCNADWSETPAGRKKLSDAEEDKEIAEIELTVVK